MADHLERDAANEASIERWKAEQDLVLRQKIADQDFALRREELQIKQREASRAALSSPLSLAVIGLIATILASIVQNFAQSRATRDLERQRFETTLIQKAVDTDDPEVAADRLKFLINLGLIHDEGGKIATYLKNPATIPLQPVQSRGGSDFRGLSRKTAKLSIGTKAVESFPNLAALMATLPATESMPKMLDKDDAARTADEQRNVRVPGFLHAAQIFTSNDYNLIVCDASDQPRHCILAVVSGLPDSKAPNYNLLKTVRETYEKRFADVVPSGGYDFYNPPVPIEVEGSLLYDTLYSTGVRPGPFTFREQLSAPWRIRPITKISFPSPAVK